MINKKKYIILAIGGGLSLLMLVVFGYAHSLDAVFLSLESRWLAAAGIPILVALLVGGFISKFKGFGIELEGELRQSVDNVYLTVFPEILLKASDVAKEAEVIAKASLEKLDQLTPEKRKTIKRLRFVMEHHYFPEVIQKYFNALPDLQFLEIRDGSDVLHCILPKQAITETNIKTFVDSLREATVSQDFRPLGVNTPILPKDNFLVAIDKLRNSGLQSLPVLDGMKVVGVLDRSSAFERLADALVQTRLKG